MGARIEISSELILEAMQSQKVRDALRARRDRVAARATQLAIAEEIDPDTITTSEGTRPKGRPYARVEARADQEFGDAYTRRARLLGRAAGGS